MSNIKNLLFDLGGVIMDIDKNNCVRAFRQLGLADAGTYFGDFKQTGPFALLESGAIDPAEFHRYMHEKISDVTDAQIDEAFEAFLTGIPVRRLEHLRTLRRRYGVYMLSNTNPIMWNSFIAQQFRQEGFDRDHYFDGIVTSFEAKVMKPDAGIFEYARRKLGIDPAATMFLDDSESNCRAAADLGWQTAHVRPGTEFMDILDQLHLL